MTNRSVPFIAVLLLLSSYLLAQEPLPDVPTPAPDVTVDHETPPEEPLPSTEPGPAAEEPKPPAAEAKLKPAYSGAVTYWPQYRSQADMGFWFFSPRISARREVSDDTVSFTSMLDNVALSVDLRFELQTPTNKVYSAEFCSFDDRSAATLGSDIQWGGGTFLNGEDVVIGAAVRYYNLSYGSTLVERDNFRFGIFLGLDMADVDLRMDSTTTSERGGMNRFVPTLTVGLDFRYYPHENWGLYGRMTGLSWTDLFGVEAGVFSPSGSYQVVSVGVIWRPNEQFQALAGYRRFVLRYDQTDEAMSVVFSGGFIGMDLVW